MLDAKKALKVARAIATISVSIGSSAILWTFAAWLNRVDGQSSLRLAAIIAAVLYAVPGVLQSLFLLLAVSGQTRVSEAIIRFFRRVIRVSPPAGAAHPILQQAALLAAATAFLVLPLAASACVLYADQLYLALYKDDYSWAERRITLAKISNLEGSILGPHAHRNVYASYALKRETTRRTYDEAEWAWSQTLALTPLPWARDDWQVMQALQHLGSLCDRQRKFHQSEEHFKKLLDLSSQWTPEDMARLSAAKARILTSEKSAALAGLARSYIEQDDYKRACKLLTEYLAVAAPLYGEAGVVTEVEQLADLYVDQQMYKEAEPLAARAVAVRKEVVASVGKRNPKSEYSAYGQLSEMLASAYRRYAKVLRGQGKEPEAERYDTLSDQARAKAYAD